MENIGRLVGVVIQVVERRKARSAYKSERSASKTQKAAIFFFIF
jgi:hypothetical protein